MPAAQSSSVQSLRAESCLLCSQSLSEVLPPPGTASLTNPAAGGFPAPEPHRDSARLFPPCRSALRRTPLTQPLPFTDGATRGSRLTHKEALSFWAGSGGKVH